MNYEHIKPHFLFSTKKLLNSFNRNLNLELVSVARNSIMNIFSSRLCIAQEHYYRMVRLVGHVDISIT